jgi:hypothetical protein
MSTSTSNEFWRLVAITESQSENFHNSISSLRKKSNNIDPHELVNFIDEYPHGSYSFGGSLPQCPMNSVNPVIVQSSHVWRTKKFVYPAKMPNFNKLNANSHFISQLLLDT